MLRKDKKLVLLIMVLLLSFSAISYAQKDKEIEFLAEQPLLVTSAGQSADVQMAKVLCMKIKLEFKFNPLATPDDLKGIKTLLIAVGGSAKGLGAAGLNVEQELVRVEKLIAKAQEAGIKMVGIHLGGKARRGELSDRFINLVVPKVSYLIVVEEGNYDEIFTKLSTQFKIPLKQVSKIAEASEPLKVVFRVK